MEFGFFPVIRVDPASVEEEEQLGSKVKFWFRHQGKRWLFKEPRPGTGEHWAEKIAAEVAALLGLSAARVELAEFSGKQGCAGLSFIQSRQTQVLIHGNELLGGLVTGYRKDQRFRQSEHTLGNIIKAVESVFPSGRTRRLAALQLAGCVVLDALIGNTDRHHENWGLLLHLDGPANARAVVAPSFDHASSLGRELLDETRDARIVGNRVMQYINHGRGGIYGDPADRHALSPLETARRLAVDFPAFYGPWKERLSKLDVGQFRGIVDRVPAEWMSPLARRFALEVLRCGLESLLHFPS